MVIVAKKMAKNEVQHIDLCLFRAKNDPIKDAMKAKCILISTIAVNTSASAAAAELETRQNVRLS